MTHPTETALVAEMLPAKSFAIRNLSVLAYANGFTLWHYKAAVMADCLAPGFFADAADMLTVGDMMLVSSPAAGGVFIVTPGQRLVSLAVGTTP